MMKPFFLWTIFTVFMLSASAQSVIFVSPCGDDCNPGDISNPVNTPERAKLIAREQDGETVIFLRGGEYRLNKPLVLTEEDGNKAKSLTVRSYPGENAVIKGSVRLNTEWEPYHDGIFRTSIEPKLDIDMLIADGNIRPMARYPDFDLEAIRFNGTSADATSKSRIEKWKHPEGGFLHAMHVCDWGDFHYRIIGKDKEGDLILEGGWQNNRQIGLSEENRMVENIFEELDAPGEWYYDNSASVLYYYPVEGEKPSDVVFEVPVTKHLIELNGCSNVTLSDLELSQTQRTFMEPYEPLLRSDWTIYRGGAVFLENTENCMIDHCYLHNLGGNAVFFSKYNRNSEVRSSHITRVGAGAILFVGSPDAVRSPLFEYYESLPPDSIDRQAGPKSDDYPAYCSVYDNLIHSIGLFEKQVTGVELSMCRDITVSHNSIYDMPRAGINVSEGTWGGHVIEYNDVFDTVKETGDHGSFNSWGRDRYWHPDRAVMDSIVSSEPSLVLADVMQPITIRNNRFRCDRGWDIDLDDGSSCYHIYNNLCLNGGIKIREGFYRNIENNILVNNTFHPHVWFENSGDIFMHNIVMRPYEPIRIKQFGTLVDYNIFTDSISYSGALENGTDRNSIVADILFINPQNGDFRIDDSMTEIFRLGFRNFAMDRFGVLSPDLRNIARTPEMPVVSMALRNNVDESITWNGLLLKGITTESERSATGMDSVRGVYVMGIAEDGSCNNTFKVNDVILRIGETDINTLSDFVKAVFSHQHSVPVIILRNQHHEKIQMAITQDVFNSGYKERF